MVHGYADLRLRPPGRPARRRQDLQREHADGHGPACRPGPGTLTLRAMLSLDPADGRERLSAAAADRRDRQRRRRRWSTASTRTTSSWSWPASTACRSATARRPSSMSAIRASRRWDRRPSCTASRAWTIRPRRSPTTGWTPPTSPSAWSPPASCMALEARGSVFNGREPDQHRWDFDPPRLDSCSGRISWNPTPDWALQVSYGYINSPEQLSRTSTSTAITASATYNRPLAGGELADHPRLGPQRQPARAHLWTPSCWNRRVNLGRHTVFARAENVQKDELFQPPSPLAGQVFRVSEAHPRLRLRHPARQAPGARPRRSGRAQRDARRPRRRLRRTRRAA